MDKKPNKQKRDAFLLRYARGKVLNPDVGGFQSAAAFAILKECDPEEGAEVDKPICITLDAYARALYAAPGASVAMYANMKVACASIAERWPDIKPPKGIIL